MSGIPKLLTWAVEALFTSGPSTGLPTKVLPTGDVFVPGTPAGAPQMNRVIADDRAQDAAIQAQGIAGALNSWSAVQAASGLSSGYPFTGASWDVAAGRWLVVAGTASGGGNFQIFETLDGGRTWTALTMISGNASQGIASANNATGLNAGPALITMPNGSALEVCVLHPDDTNNVHTVTSFPATTATPFALPFSFSTGVVWGILAANQAGGTFTGGSFLQTSDGATINVTPISIGAWNADTNHVGQFLAASSATTILAALCGVTAGTDTARLMTITADGSAHPVFTDISTGATFLPGTVIMGVAYDGIAWGVLVYTGADSLLYTSGDLASWALQKRWTGVKCSGLATVGPVWAVGVPYTTSPDAGARIQICSNIDSNIGVVGQAMFSWTQSGLLDSVPLPLAFASSGNGLFAASAAKAQISQTFAQL